MNKTSYLANESTGKLLEAVRKLQAFVEWKEKSNNRSTFSKALSYLRALLPLGRSETTESKSHRYRIPGQAEVREAIDIISRSRFVLANLKHKDPLLAASLAKTIAHYNAGCDEKITNYVKSQPFSHFLRKQTPSALPKISQPLNVTVYKHYSEKGDSPQSNTDETSRTVSAASVLLNKQSTELFHMKVLALLEKYGIAPNHEARMLIKESPIHIESESDPSRCTLVQTLSLFPGQTVVIKGSTILDTTTQAVRKLFPETFSLTLESTQTGFPHPIQRSGWSLGTQLLPDFPQRVDLLPNVGPMFQKRPLAVAGLQPQGDLLRKAKGLIAAKKQAFNKHAKELLSLHRQLALTIVSGGSQSEHLAARKADVEAFIDFLLASNKPYDELAEAYQMMREYFIAKTHKKLVEGIVKGKTTPLASNDESERLKALEALFDVSMSDSRGELQTLCNSIENHADRLAFRFALSLGDALSGAIKGIILQYLSEDLIYPPPRLTPFYAAVQESVYSHLGDFNNELLNEGVPATMFEKLRDTLSADIDLLACKSTTGVAKELAAYFDQRHESLL